MCGGGGGERERRMVGVVMRASNRTAAAAATARQGCEASSSGVRRGGDGGGRWAMRKHGLHRKCGGERRENSCAALMLQSSGDYNDDDDDGGGHRKRGARGARRRRAAAATTHGAAVVVPQSGEIGIRTSGRTLTRCECVGSGASFNGSSSSNGSDSSNGSSKSNGTRSAKAKNAEPVHSTLLKTGLLLPIRLLKLRYSALVSRRLRRTRRDVARQFEDVDVRKVVSLLSLFFCLAFNNAIVDSMKDALIVTSGGAEQLPFLTVYAVLPASAVFVYAYKRASQVLSRSTLFHLALGVFVSFFALFGFVLHPNIGVLHATDATAAQWLAALPGGLAPAVGMLQHWSYTLFYTFAELWGDVVLSLLFWGLANECTKVHEAGTVYPIICFGANLAYTVAGALMGMLGNVGLSWGQQLRCLMAVFVTVSLFASRIYSRVRYLDAKSDSTLLAANAIDEQPASSSQAAPAPKKAPKRAKRKSSSLLSLIRTREIGHLAAMSVAQGVAFSIFQVSWKSQIRTLCPSPELYNAMMANVQMWSGITTLAFIAVAPVIFRVFGWTGAAVTTPIVMATGGTLFLAVSPFCVNNPALAVPVALLGSSVYIFMKAAKFSLFKPSEEMVYIDLDEESKTSGKAAVDVLGAQAGKAGGSCVQQCLLFCFQSLSAAMVPLLALHCSMVSLWLLCIKRLAPSMIAKSNAEHAASSGSSSSTSSSTVSTPAAAPLSASVAPAVASLAQVGAPTPATTPAGAAATTHLASESTFLSNM